MRLSKGRDTYLDWIKGILIILVVVGHCIQYGSGRPFLDSSQFLDDRLFLVIYTFHMPLFIGISGLLLGMTYERHTLKELVSRRIQTLLVPILVWNTLDYAVEYALYSWRRENGLLLGYVKAVLSNKWFLWAVLLLSLFACAVGKCIADRKRRLLVYAAVFVLLYFLPEDNLFLGISQFKFVYPYFILGFEAAPAYQRASEEGRDLLPAWVTFGSLVLWLVLLPFYRRDSYIYTSGYRIWRDHRIVWTQLLIDLYRMTIGLAGSLFLFDGLSRLYRLLKRMGKRMEPFNRGLEQLGNASIGIYILSERMALLGLRNLTKNFVPAYWITLLESVCVIAASWYLTGVIRRYPRLNRLLFGGRQGGNTQ